MGDHFELLVDRLLTESTIEAVIESKKQLQHDIPSASEDMMNGFSSHTMDANSGSSPRKLVLCRICHDEDEDSNMEIPSSCCGTLKEAGNVSRFASDQENELPQLQPQLHLIHNSSATCSFLLDAEK
ncbi:hypothetical protein LOK49_LG04G03239 [Camellia lanceoleosa]|uniref:Uncharacterized protein n=1 Tax=Camellia lanceoleosa TaxID=1840588 RepID=A0ACC0HYH9_9ERIC|nr:hypothetical protein LOK49_LG04G03239 [Camellia lanceoleosa]